MRDAGIKWPNPVQEITTPDTPVNLNSLQYHVLYVQKNKRDKEASFFYLNQRGEWCRIKCTPFELSQVAEKLNLTYTPKNKSLEKLESKIALPDYIFNIPVDKAILHEVIRRSITKDRDPRWERWKMQTVEINGVSVDFYDNQSDLQTFHAEEKLTGGYLQAMLNEIIKQPELLNENLHEDYTKIMSQLNKAHNQWLTHTSIKANISNLPFTEDESLPVKNPDVWGLLTKINTPKFNRLTGNNNAKTFDYIELHFGIRSKESLVNRDAFIKSCIKDIVQIGLIKIRDSSRFQSFGIPINFLKATRYVITRQDELVLTYELKIKGEKSCQP